MRSTDFPFAVTPRRYAEGGPSFADRARTVAKGATFAFNDEIEAGLRALAKLDPAAYQREVARIRAQQAAYEEANPYESAGLEIGGAMLPALLPGGQGPAAARMALLAAKAPRAARIAPVVGEAALYGVGAADSMADIPSSVLSEGAQALGMYGVGAAAAPRLKALGAKLAARLRPSKGTAAPAMAVKPQALPAPEASLAVKPQGITAYHGSPHSFDRFDISKIGTGEGAQAYGHGLYFAENEGVAQSYKQALTTGAMNSTEFKKIGLSPNDRRNAMMFARTTHPLFPEVAARDFANYLGKEVTPALIEAYRKTMAIPTGSMYQVRIDADPADFLDYDAPLSGQPQRVREGVARAMSRGDETLGDLFGDLSDPNAMQLAGLFPKSSGAQVYNTITASDRAAATQALREAGIPGIKYLDQGSRGAGDGTRNFVVFDDKLISILKKYGWAPGMAIPAAAMAEYEAEQELARGGFAVKKGR
jgi:hypothetical protein